MNRRPHKPGPTRRRFLQAAGAVVSLGAGAGLYAWRIEPHWLRFESRDLPIRGLPAAWSGRVIAQVSDIHAGKVDPDYLKESFRELGDRAPDLIVFTGDYMSSHGGERIDDVARVLEHCPVPPLGRIGILGNHDYGSGWENAKVADKLTRRLEAMGVTVLRNESVLVEGLRIVGLDDLWGTNWDPDPVLKALKPEEPTLVPCHNPDAADLPMWAGYRGWILSGHTHGGQCKPPFLPPPILPVRNPLYTAGEFDLGDGRRMYINSGLGYVRRVRFNVRPEITLFRMIRA